MLITLNEVAKNLGTSRQNLQHYVDRGDLKAKRADQLPKDFYYVDVRDFHDFVEKLKARGRTGKMKLPGIGELTFIE